MEPQDLLNISRDAVFVLIKVSTPVLLVALIIGLMISLVQALTQIQEATLSFVPKLIAVLLCLVFAMPYMGGQLKVFTERIHEKIVGLP